MFVVLLCIVSRLHASHCVRYSQVLDEPCLGEAWQSYGEKMRLSVASPKYRVRSLCQPRACLESSWSKPMMCTFDNMFSLANPGRRFIFGKHDRIPTSKDYTYFTAWTDENQTQSIQFMAIHCHGSKRKLIYDGYIAKNQSLVTRLPALRPD